MKFGFIGGNGHHYLRAAMGEGDSAVVSHDGVDEAAARSWRERMLAGQGGDWIESPERLLESGIEVLSVGAVYGVNNKWVCAALEAGIPVVSDKPLATTREQLEKLKVVVRKSAGKSGGGVVVTEFDMRCRAEFAAARKAVREGRIGEVTLATGQKSYRWGNRPEWYKNRELYGGTILWVAAHAIDAIAFATGLEMKAVGGVCGNVSHPEYGSVEDYTVTTYQIGGKAGGVVHADYLRPASAPTHGDDRIRVAGTGGVLEVREGRCVLIGKEGVQDITGECEARVPGKVMLADALGRGDGTYGTEHSLALAELLLASREATDPGARHV